MHGVLAADLIGEGGDAVLILDPAHHVQIGHARFDHHHVGSFGDVLADLVQCLVAVGRIHLVGLLAALAQVGRRADRIAERAIVVGGVLGRVGHDLGVDETVGLQRLTDGADAAIHHVGGGHHIGAGPGLAEGLPYQCLGGDVVQHIAALIDDAVLAMGGVGVESHIGDDAQLRVGRLQGAHDARHQAIVIPGGFGIQTLALLANHREQGDGRNAQRHQLGGLLQQQIQTQPLDAGHAGHRLAAVFPLQHEDRIDEIVDGQDIFPHQAAAEVMLAQTAWTAGGKGGGNKLGHGVTSSRRKKARLVARVWRSSCSTGSPRRSAMVAAI